MTRWPVRIDGAPTDQEAPVTHPDPAGYPAYQAQPYQPQPYDHAPPIPMGTVRLTLQPCLIGGPKPPSVKLNGHPIQTAWGTFDVPLPVGRYLVEVLAFGRHPYGPASMEIDLRDGQVVPVCYTPPVMYLLPGAIGHVRQKSPGLVPFFVFAALLIAFGLIRFFLAGGFGM